MNKVSRFNRGSNVVTLESTKLPLYNRLRIFFAQSMFASLKLILLNYQFHPILGEQVDIAESREKEIRSLIEPCMAPSLETVYDIRMLTCLWLSYHCRCEHWLL